MAQLKRYMIEREIPGIGGMSIVELCGAARSSKSAMKPRRGSRDSGPPARALGPGVIRMIMCCSICTWCQ